MQLLNIFEGLRNIYIYGWNILILVICVMNKSESLILFGQIKCWNSYSDWLNENKSDGRESKMHSKSTTSLSGGKKEVWYNF